MDEELRREISHNFDYLQRSLRDHLRAHAGEYALIKGARVHGFFGTAAEADHAGWSQFPDRLYSIQQITPEPVDLGLYANSAN